MRMIAAMALVAAFTGTARADEDPFLDPDVEQKDLGRLGGGVVTLVDTHEIAMSGYMQVRLEVISTPARGQPVRQVLFDSYCMDWSVKRHGDAVRLTRQCGRFDDDTLVTDYRLRGRRWVAGPSRSHSPYARGAAAIVRQLARGRIAQATAAREQLGDSSSGHDELTAWWDEVFRRAGAGARRALLVDAPALLAVDHPSLAVYLRAELHGR
jgi:hypothetical protein